VQTRSQAPADLDSQAVQDAVADDSSDSDADDTVMTIVDNCTML